jgi:hypothetical protein
LAVVFFAVVEAPAGGRSEVCMRKEAVRTNWPTAAENPERKALKGCCAGQVSLDLLLPRRETYVVPS